MSAQLEKDWAIEKFMKWMEKLVNNRTIMEWLNGCECDQCERACANDQWQDIVHFPTAQKLVLHFLFGDWIVGHCTSFFAVVNFVLKLNGRLGCGQCLNLRFSQHLFRLAQDSFYFLSFIFFNLCNTSQSSTFLCCMYLFEVCLANVLFSRETDGCAKGEHKTTNVVHFNWIELV